MSVTCGHPTLLAVYQRRLPAFVPSRCTQGHSAASIILRASLMPSETSRRAGILSISSGTTTAPGAILLVLGSRDYELPSAPTAGTSRHSTALLRAFQRFSPPYFTSGRRLPCSRNLIKLNYASALFAVPLPSILIEEYDINILSFPISFHSLIRIGSKAPNAEGVRPWRSGGT